MKHLISDNFKKKLDCIPDKAWSKSVIIKLADFSEKLLSARGVIRNLPAGFWVRNIKGTKIFKFRVNNGDRILFTMYSDLDRGRNEYDNSILFIDYCTHDEQARVAKRLVNIDIDTTPFLETKNEAEEDVELLKTFWSRSGYDLNKSITYVIHNDQLSSFIDKNNKDWLFYLNDEQYECVKHSCSPLFLRGSAGSGKTTVALHKLLANSNSSSRVAYLTYTQYLLDNAQKLYKNYADNSFDTSFYKVTDLCFQILKVADYNLVGLDRFHQWFEENTFRYRFFEGFDPVDLWAEIRGIVKGFMGINWDRDVNVPLISEASYLGLSDTYSVFSNNDRKTIYAISVKYQDWLESNSLYDENDIARKALLKNIASHDMRYNFIVVDEVQDLTEVQIRLLLSLVAEPDKIFFSGDEHQIVNPTYFSFGRIGVYFNTIYGMERRLVTLKQNYRSQGNIVNLANSMIEQRRKYIGATNCDYHETHIRSGSNPYLVINNKEIIDKILLTANDRHYCIIITSDNAEKLKLKKILGETSRVFTVNEIKGLEYSYVVCFNLLSNSKSCWSDIFDGVCRHDARYRYYFNSFYVAVTRARENLLIYEDDEDSPLLGRLNNVFDEVNEFDEQYLGLLRFSDVSDWLKDAEELEAKDKLEQAIGSYINAKNERGVARCKGKILAKAGKYSEAGDVLVAAGMFKEANEYYQRSGNSYKSLNSQIMAGDSFESIKNSGMDLNTQIQILISNHETGKDISHISHYFDGIICKDIEKMSANFSDIIELIQLTGRQNEY